jgi:hypothetical protein
MLSLTINRPMGIVAGLVNKENQPAAEIVREMVNEAVQALKSGHGYISTSAKL